jgi:sec-independent protein translocase protein TatC
MSLAEHLYELRNRLAKSLLAIALGMVVVGLVFYQPVFDFLREPYCRTAERLAERGQTAIESNACSLFVRDIFAQFQVRLRVAGIVGTVVAAPVWLYQLGAFITPALHRREKRYAAAFLVGSLVLFSTGAVFAYLTMDKGLYFLLTVGGEGLVTLPDLQSYLSFVSLTLFSFGIAFLFPVVLVFLNLTGALSARRMGGMWRPMIAGIAFMSAVLTPSTDPITFVAMAVPVSLLYLLCIGIAWVVDRGRRRRRAEDGLEELGDDETSYVDPRPSEL